MAWEPSWIERRLWLLVVSLIILTLSFCLWFRLPTFDSCPHRYSTVSTLLQYYVLLPLKHKDTHLIYLTNELSSSSMIIFTRTVNDAQRLSIMLRLLGFPAIPLHGQLSQSSRLGALNKFKSGGRKILVATDVASR